MEASTAPVAVASAPELIHKPQRASGGVDTTRVLNLFGYVGPVASLMSHTLFPGASPASARSVHIQRMPGVGAAGAGASGDGRLSMRQPSGLTPGRTKFVLSRTEDAMDSVLPCAAERMFHRPGRFANANNLRFDYSS
ncbi:hypothetical protein Rsub_03952 [Raphidocelis subcapitata]|uniref:Uncharacterized protein n=1 Tax=Raphidocelis subcapitata TaxID=307507 RepID=A0A2V0NVH9_9CHLO|nr:hypothetical protein Rsub_03952 [Raphidocelis subcapitata]|eukprot:GBF91648.1 hypothetical protein Rsub_03952 [Raphidocelis subcapitata]